MRTLKLTVTFNRHAILELRVVGDQFEVAFIRDVLTESYPESKGYRITEESI